MAERQIRRPVTEEDIRKWEKDWADMMITIWREQIMRLGIVDTMKLYNNITESIAVSDQIVIAHEFMTYGIYMAAGVGKGYKKGNGGNLEILDPAYRKAHHLDKPRPRGPKWSITHMSTGKPRKKRDWFSKKYLRSVYVLTETERNFYGEAYLGTMSNVVQTIFGTTREEQKINVLRNF